MYLKQETAYEFAAWLVGAERCMRDSERGCGPKGLPVGKLASWESLHKPPP